MIKQSKPQSDFPAAIGVQFIETPRFLFRASWTRVGLYEFGFSGKPVEHRLASGEIERSSVGDVKLGSRVAVHDDGLQVWIRNAPSRIAGLTSLLKEAAMQYFQTGHFEWSLSDLDWAGISPFHQAVLRACYRIPKGEVSTYGQLAAGVGSPKAARAVGGAMAKNRWPLIIPCHRVVGSSGKLTGYSGMDGIETKRDLLELEGVAIA